MLRAVLVSALLILAAAPSARAEIRVIDTKTGASRTLVRERKLDRLYAEDGQVLMRWSDDGSALVARPRETMLRFGITRGGVTHLWDADQAVALGSGGRWVDARIDRRARTTLVLRRSDGGALGIYGLGDAVQDPSVAWSPDGTRVALAMAPQLVVADTTTGAVILRRKLGEEVELGEQAFAPDASALLVTDEDRLLRISVPDGAEAVVRRGSLGEPPLGEWSRSGRISIGVLEDPAYPGGLPPATWTPAGDALTRVFAGPKDDCSFPSQGIAVGQRVVLPARDRAIEGYAWSPDGTQLAVNLVKGEAPRAKRRGRRHPWPKHLRRDYALFSRKANRAARRLVLRAARALRHGAGRELTLRDVRIGITKLDERFEGVSDTDTLEALADGLDPWLHAAGFERIDALGEIVC